MPQIWLNPGEHILLPDPGYPDYLSGVAIAQATLDLLPITAEHDWLPDYTQVAPEVAEAAKLLYLNYPNNPTGAVATPEFFEETVDFARQHDIKVVHDFAYGALGTPDKRPVSFLQAPGAKDVGIEFYTLSKTYNMAGWRIGFAAGNQDLIEAINLIQDHMLVSVFPAVQEAGVAALNGDQSSVASLVALYQNGVTRGTRPLIKSAGTRHRVKGLSTPGCQCLQATPVASSVNYYWIKRMLRSLMAVALATTVKVMSASVY